MSLEVWNKTKLNAGLALGQRAEMGDALVLSRFPSPPPLPFLRLPHKLGRSLLWLYAIFVHLLKSYKQVVNNLRILKVANQWTSYVPRARTRPMRNSDSDVPLDRAFLYPFEQRHQLEALLYKIIKWPLPKPRDVVMYVILWLSMCISTKSK